jgi:adenosine deaminase
VPTNRETLPNILPDYSNYWLHRVNEFDTLKTIALKYFQTEEYWKKIYKSNMDRIANNYIIKAGLILRIPREEEWSNLTNC